MKVIKRTLSVLLMGWMASISLLWAQDEKNTFNLHLTNKTNEHYEEVLEEVS